MLFLSTALASPSWTWVGPPPGSPSTGVEVDAGEAVCRFEIGEPWQTVACSRDGEDLWIQRTDGPLQGASLAYAEGRLVVARYSPSGRGATVAVYDVESGLERWIRPVVGLGSTPRVEYRHDVQVQVEDGLVRVLGWEMFAWQSTARYAEGIDPVTGIQTEVWSELGAAKAVPDPSAPWTSWGAREPTEGTPIPWAWTPTSHRGFDRRVVVTEADHTCTFAMDQATAALGCGDWLRSTREHDAAALALQDGVLYAVRFHPIASGATAYAYDAASGREIWRRALWGRGPISHSRYRNEVQVRIDGDSLVVFGDEADGRYVEVLDRKSGASTGHRALD